MAEPFACTASAMALSALRAGSENAQILALNGRAVDFNRMANPHAKGRIENLRPFPKGKSGNPGSRRKPREPQDVIEAAYKEAEVIIIEDIREAVKRLTGKP
jgi:hypothetical protein